MSYFTTNWDERGSILGNTVSLRLTLFRLRLFRYYVDTIFIQRLHTASWFRITGWDSWRRLWWRRQCRVPQNFDIKSHDSIIQSYRRGTGYYCRLYLHVRVFITKNLYLHSRSYYLYCNAYCGGWRKAEERNLLILKSIIVKMGPLSVVSHKVAVYENVTTMLNKDVLYCVIVFKGMCACVVYITVRQPKPIFPQDCSYVCFFHFLSTMLHYVFRHWMWM
jgi:hypothetical protein